MRLAWTTKEPREGYENQRADNRLAFGEGRKRQFALILPSRGRVLRPPHLPDECTTTCDMLRTMLQRLIMASGLMDAH
jgi:hypothetical protein